MRRKNLISEQVERKIVPVLFSDIRRKIEQVRKTLTDPINHFVLADEIAVLGLGDFEVVRDLSRSLLWGERE